MISDICSYRTRSLPLLSLSQQLIILQYKSKFCSMEASRIMSLITGNDADLIVADGPAYILRE